MLSFVYLCNEMFIFFPFLVGDGNHWRACCGNSWQGRRETFSLERVAVAQPHLAQLRARESLRSRGGGGGPAAPVFTALF